MIHKITFLILFLIHNLLSAQDGPPSITLVSNKINKAHPFYNILIKKDAKYINWFYFHNKGLSHKNTQKVAINRSLIFTIKKENSLRIDTITNYTHPKLYENEREPEWESEIPLYGSFPEYINFHLTNDPQTATNIDLSIHKTSSTINMYVLTDKGDMVSKVINKRLKQGSHKIRWDTNDIKSGNYLLFTEIDTHLIIHQVTVEKNWFANIFSRDKEVSRTKRIFKTSFETSDMPSIKEREFHYVLRNRFGTSFGIHLLGASMVKIKLYTINGEYISTIHDKKLDTGDSEFLLDKHVKKDGWYLLQFTINNKRKHIKINIKK